MGKEVGRFNFIHFFVGFVNKTAKFLIKILNLAFNTMWLCGSRNVDIHVFSNSKVVMLIHQ